MGFAMQPMQRTLALLLALLPLVLVAAPPNILLIVSDDQGYRDLGCFDSDEVITPSLDRLARGGVKLTSFLSPGRPVHPREGRYSPGDTRNATASTI